MILQISQYRCLGIYPDELACLLQLALTPSYWRKGLLSFGADTVSLWLITVFSFSPSSELGKVFVKVFPKVEN